MIYGELQEYEQEKSNADDAINMKERLVDPAQVTGSNQPMFVGKENGDCSDANEVNYPKLRRGGPV